MSVVIPILTEFSGKGIERAKREFAQLEGASAKAGFILKKAMIPAGIAIGAVGAAAVEAGQALLGMAKAAAEDQAEQVALAKALKNTVGATSSQIAAVEDFIDVTQRATGVADSRLRPAFSRLVRSTKDVEKAQKLLNLSLDVAAVTGRPLEQIANAIGRSYDGQNAALGRLGLGIDAATLKSMEFADVQALLEQRFGGGASAAAETFQGKMARLQIRFDEMQETIGAALLPLLERFADVAMKVADAFAEGGLGGALKALQRESPGFYQFMRNTYNVIAAIGDAIYNVIQLQKAMFAVFQGKMPDLSFGYYMPKWEDLLKSRAGMSPRAGGNTVVPILGGIPGLALPEGGTPAAPGAGVAGPQGGTGGVRGQSMRPINVTVTSADPRAVVDALQKYERQNGAIPISTR